MSPHSPPDVEHGGVERKRDVVQVRTNHRRHWQRGVIDRNVYDVSVARGRHGEWELLGDRDRVSHDFRGRFERDKL